MNNIVFLIMRRMRAPLFLLLSVYMLAIVGMTLVPGVREDGSIWYMDFFHAFYFVSYMGTTIGFGEVPYEFSGAQRMWVTFSIYLTVVSWLYAIGTLMTLAQNEALKRTLIERRFARTVKNIHEPFFLIGGYGDTGQALVSGLEERFLRSVVLEKRQERINALLMENYPVYVPKLCADASYPYHLIEGGLKNPYCEAVVAITNDNNVNLHVAITAKLLNSKVKVICRVDSVEVAENMAAFSADYIINPFVIFAKQLHVALNTPSLHLMREWLIGKHGNNLSDNLLHPPQHGLWILCGYGRFGKAVYEQLEREVNIRVVVVESNPRRTGYPKGEYVVGRGTESHVLKRAHIEQAVGMVAGTDSDIDNLAIVMQARQLNPGLFVILRQNNAANELIFKAAKAEIVMQASQIIADHIRVLLTTPLLADFIRLSKWRGNHWANYVLSRLIGVLPDDMPPSVWETEISEQETPTVCAALAKVQSVNLAVLLRDPRDRAYFLNCIPLLLVKANEEQVLLPEETECLTKGDRILWCGEESMAAWMDWTLKDEFVYAFIVSGKILPRSAVWRWWCRLRDKK